MWARSNVPWFLLARILAVLTLATLPMAFGVTNAKYIAQATSAASARVAKWKVLATAEDLPAPTKDGLDIPAQGDPDDHPLVLFFEGIVEGTPANTNPVAPVTFKRKKAKFPVELINDSEVTARFTAIWTTASGTADFSFEDGDGDPIDSLILAPKTSEVVTAVIASSTFTDLKFGAHVEQVN